jgi:hypothetical protein
MYPDIEDGREENDGFEHPMTAVGVVLLSAVLLDTTEMLKLAAFTGYSHQFISAISWNMQNNNLWTDGKYRVSDWSGANGVDPEQFFFHIEIACGGLWQPDSQSLFSMDTCKIYWDERKQPQWPSERQVH